MQDVQSGPYVLENGSGVKQSDFEAVKYYRKACTLEEGLGCSNLGFMYENGSGVKQSVFEAVKYYRKACTLEMAVWICQW